MMKDKKLGGEHETHSSGDMHFHYNREERMGYVSSGIRNRGSGRKGIFKNNRSLLILFIDILVILMIGIIFSIYGGIFGNSRSYNGYNLNLEAFEYDEKVYVRLKVTAKRDTAELETNLIEGTFYYGDGKESGAIAEILPAVKGESRVIRTVFPKTRGVKQARAEVIFLNKEYELKTEIKDE